MTVGQMIGAGVIAVGMPFGYPAFALLYGVSSAIRVIAYRDAAPRTEPAIAQSAHIAQNQKTAEAEATAVA